MCQNHTLSPQEERYHFDHHRLRQAAERRRLLRESGARVFVHARPQGFNPHAEQLYLKDPLQAAGSSISDQTCVRVATNDKSSSLLIATSAAALSQEIAPHILGYHDMCCYESLKVMRSACGICKHLLFPKGSNHFSSQWQDVLERGPRGPESPSREPA